MYNGYYTYAAPFKQLVSDNSISNATVISGLYVGSDFVTPGTNDLSGINYDEGQAYFSSVPTGTVSGNYAIKEYSVHLTDQSESELLFETKFHLKPRITEAKAGLETDTATYPSVHLKLTKSENMPFAFGGQEETHSEIRAIVFSDSQFSLDAICSILGIQNMTIYLCGKSQKCHLIHSVTTGMEPNIIIKTSRQGCMVKSALCIVSRGPKNGKRAVGRRRNQGYESSDIYRRNRFYSKQAEISEKKLLVEDRGN